MSKGLNGKVVVITGASSGIGKAMAREYAAMGAKVVLGARQAEKLEALTKEIVANGGKAAWCATDVTKVEDCQKLIQTAVDTFGGIDVLICNAGISMRALFDDLDLSVLHQVRTALLAAVEGLAGGYFIGGGYSRLARQNWLLGIEVCDDRLSGDYPH